MVTWYEEIAPTGRYRFREKRRWFRKPLQVKQIEVRVRRFTSSPVDVEVEEGLAWRDERLTDHVYTDIIQSGSTDG